METMTCKTCGQTLPETAFRRTRWGGYAATCNRCVTEKTAQSRFSRSQMGGGKTAPFPDPDFDGKDPGEIIRMMGRAKRWLESRGFIIRLDGEFTECDD